MKTVSLPFALALLGASAHAADRPPLLPLEQAWEMMGEFVVGEPGEFNISGIACEAPDTEGARRCLVTDDETLGVQFARLFYDPAQPEHSRLEARNFVTLIELDKDKTIKNVMGEPPTGKCGDLGKPNEFDGEAVALAGDAYFIVGSHGCSRGKDKFKLSAFILAELPLPGAGTPPRLTFRLATLLAADKTLGPSFATSLKDKGLNIEGLAVTGDTLHAGLRAPVANDAVYIVSAPVAPLFSDNALPASTLQLRPVTLGGENGIRDLEAVGDGGLIILAGPSIGETGAYELLELAGDAATPISLGRLSGIPTGADGEPAKAEAIEVLANQDGTRDILVLFDGVKGGGPLVYRVPPP